MLETIFTSPAQVDTRLAGDAATLGQRRVLLASLNPSDFFEAVCFVRVLAHAGYFGLVV